MKDAKSTKASSNIRRLCHRWLHLLKQQLK